MSNRIDSALGRQCGSIANFVKGTIAKIANLPQSLQSNHSPTANLRIFESQLVLSLRGSEATEAIHKTQKVDSSFKAMDRHADKSARDDRETKSATSFKESRRILGFAMRKLCFTSAGEGIYLGDNEQARAK